MKKILEKVFDSIFEIVIKSVVIGTITFILYIVLVGGPTYLSAEAECLRKGYPKAAISIGMERYCMNLDGSITVKVEKL